MVEHVRKRLGIDVQSKEHKQIADKATKFFHTLLSDISTDKNQAISKEEWISYFEEGLGGSFKEEALEEYQQLIFRYMFDFFDHNRDGFITRNEYQDRKSVV